MNISIHLPPRHHTSGAIQHLQGTAGTKCSHLVARAYIGSRQPVEACGLFLVD